MASDLIVVLRPAADGERFVILSRSTVPLGPYLWSGSMDEWRAAFVRWVDAAALLSEDEVRSELARMGMPSDDVEDQIDRARNYAAAEAELKWERTTAIGFRNAHDQEVVLKTAAAGRVPGQRVYVLRCNTCGHEYGADGCDIHKRRCPRCQDGLPGMAADPSIETT